MTIRHPVAVAYATKKWTRRTLDSLIRHWLVSYERFLSDAPQVPRVKLVRYEDLVAQPAVELGRVFSFLGLNPIETRQTIDPTVNDGYFRRWRPGRLDPFKRVYVDLLTRRYERRVNRLGYSLSEPRAVGAPPPEVLAYL
jgi:hypothetical protein